VSEVLAQGPYVVDGVGFELATLRKAPNLSLSHHVPQLFRMVLVFSVLIKYMLYAITSLITRCH